MVVLPSVNAATTPVAEIVATLVLVLLHIPPPVPEVVRLLVVPGQSVVEPAMVPGAGSGLTVTIEIAATAPHTLVTV